MQSFDVFTIVAAILALVLLLILFMIPVEKRKTKRRKSGTPAGEKKDWEAISQRLEKHIYALRRDIEAAQKREKILEREKLVQEEKYKRLQEKVTQERRWKEKEGQDIEKTHGEIKRLRQNFKEVETQLGEADRLRLRMENELKDTRDQLAQETEKRRALEADIQKLKAQADAYRRDMTELRAANDKLSRKQEETTFISRAEYEKLAEKFKEAQKRLERLQKG